MLMPNIDYREVIKEGQKELQKLEKRLRYTQLFHRVKMLRVLTARIKNLDPSAVMAPGTLTFCFGIASTTPGSIVMTAAVS